MAISCRRSNTVMTGLSKEVLFFLKTNSRLKDLGKCYGITLFINLTGASISMEGHHPPSLEQLVKDLHQLLEGLSRKEAEKTCQFIKCFSSISNETLVELMKKEHLKAGWDVREGKLFVCSDSESNASRASQLIESLVIEKEYPPGGRSLSADENLQLLADDAWLTLQESLKKKCSSLEMRYDDEKSVIRYACGSADHADMVSLALNELFRRCQWRSFTMNMGNNINRLLFTHCSKIKEKYPDSSIEMKPDSLELEIKTSQPDQVKASIDELLASTMTRTITEESSAMWKWLQTKEGQERLDDIARLTKTVMELPNSISPSEAPLGGYLDKIQLMHGDMTSANVSLAVWQERT